MMENKIRKLEKWYHRFPGTITAFSGGVDSGLVLFLSKKFLPDSSIACISDSPSLKRKDFQLAKGFCKKYEITLEVIETEEVDDEKYYSNPANRCFFCKTHLYSDLQKVKEKYPGYILLNGTNKDDFGDYRPGLKAAGDFEIRSPLAECGLQKKDVRNLARYFGLPTWDKPASPCLSSRVPYGQIITKQKLKQIEFAEEILNSFGFRDVRIRHHDNEASIEVPESMVSQLKAKFHSIEKSIKELGFESCIIDEEGLVSGKLNRKLIHKNGRSV